MTTRALGSRSLGENVRKVATVLVLLVVLCWSGLAQTQAQGEITVISQTHDNHFPQDITFHLKAQAAQNITKVTLYYRVGSSVSDSYAYPTFTPGPSVQADYVLATSGARYIVPGASLQYYYQIDDAAGNQLKTQPVTLTYDDTRFTWQKIQGDQLTVYWYALQPVAQQVFQTGQATLAKMKLEAGESLARPVKIYVYASKREMDVALPFQSRTSSQDIITEGQAFSEADQVMILGSVQDVPGTTAHELTHLITDQLTGNPFAGIPTWLNEGLSMYAEGELRRVNQQALDAAIRGNSLLNLHTISSLPGRPEDVNLFYGEAYSVVRHLISTYGSDKMTLLLSTFKQGTKTDDALMKVYGFNVDGLEAKWRASIGAAPGPTAAAQAGPAQAPSVPTIAPFGSNPQGAAPQPTPVATTPSARNNTVLYVAMAAGLVILIASFFVAVRLSRRR